MAKEPFEAVNANELIGKVLDGRYKVESVLGQGGMGMVFKGIQTSVQRPVALKTLHPQLAMAPTFFERFKREAEMASRLHHPNIITIYDFGKTAEGLCYYVMEMLEGESLRDRIKREGPFTLRQAAAIIEQSAAGVAHAHHTQVIHRDLKPHNIMLTSVDGNEYVKVLDFGLVKALEQEEEEQLTSTGQVLGTPQYMPPEQAGGEVVDQRSDLFSLTGVFYYCLTGHSPYGANSVRKALTLALAANVPPIDTYRKGSPVPKSIDEFMVKGLRPEKEDRFQTAEDFVQSLHAALAGTPDSVLDAVPIFTADPTGKESGSGSSSASRKSGGSRAKGPSKAISAVSRPLPRQASRLEERAVTPPPQPQGVPLGALVGVVAVIVVLIGGAVVWKMTSKPPEPDQVPVQVAIDQPSTPVTQKVELAPAKVVLKTNPDGAEVLEGGVMIGNTPLTLDWARGSTRELTFKLAGHKDLVKSLRSEADQSFDFQLEAASSPKPPPGKKPPPKKDPDIGAFD
ncbi:MAG: serine/threonine-protein kinase [Archangium sp.]|nr:serine/threonine-protein kinase [Archangium sp.]MDP3155477.1 serine/threonine-protein kinase [Archangium sp.]MDP3573809.1 serine/threonine-protein kinase [Archangium sp.]